MLMSATATSRSRTQWNGGSRIDASRPVARAYVHWHDSCRPGTVEQKSVVGLFETRGGAEAALHELEQAGFARDQISLALSERDAVDAPGAQTTEAAGTGE